MAASGRISWIPALRDIQHGGVCPPSGPAFSGQRSALAQSPRMRRPTRACAVELVEFVHGFFHFSGIAAPRAQQGVSGGVSGKMQIICQPLHIRRGVATDGRRAGGDALPTLLRGPTAAQGAAQVRPQVRGKGVIRPHA